MCSSQKYKLNTILYQKPSSQYKIEACYRQLIIFSYTKKTHCCNKINTYIVPESEMSLTKTNGR